MSLKLWRKGNCEAQTSWCCWEADLKTCTKIWAVLPVLSRMSWILVSNSHTSETEITPPPESCRGEMASTSANPGVRNELLCIGSGLISLPIVKIQGDVIWWYWGLERPGARSKLQFRSIRNSTNQAEKPWRDWRSNDIRLITGCVQFQCLDGISEVQVESG